VVGEAYFSPLKCQYRLGARLASCSMCTGLFRWEYSCRSGKLTTHLDPVPKLGMSGTLLPLPHTPSDTYRVILLLPYPIPKTANHSNMFQFFINFYDLVTDFAREVCFHLKLLESVRVRRSEFRTRAHQF